MLLDPELFAKLESIRTAGTKTAFAPSPSVQQAVMAGAQGGGDPGMGGGAPPPGAGAPPGAMPPPPGGMGGPPMDPAAGGPPPDASTPPPPNPEIAELKQLIMQMMQGGAGGPVGPGGKPNMASVKIEPQHFHTLVHKISNIEAVMTQMADQLGLQVPASELLNQSTAPGTTPLPGDPGAGGDPAAGAGGAPAGPPGGGGGSPGPGVAQRLPNLPSLPPMAAKAAQGLDVCRTSTDVARLGRLGTGFVVGGAESPKAGTTTTSKLAAFVARKGTRC